MRSHPESASTKSQLFSCGAKDTLIVAIPGQLVLPGWHHPVQHNTKGQDGSASVEANR